MFNQFINGKRFAFAHKLCSMINKLAALSNFCIVFLHIPLYYCYA